MEQPWQLPATLDRMRVNAALTTLTERYDADAARDVILAFQDLSADTCRRSQATHHLPTQTTISGETPEHGSIRVTETSKTTRTVGGQRVEVRLGSFRVFRTDRPGYYPVIWFRPFWTSSLETAIGHRPDEFSLVYDAARRMPIRLNRYEWRLGTASFAVRLRCALQFRSLFPFWIPIVLTSMTHAETMHSSPDY